MVRANSLFLRIIRQKSGKDQGQVLSDRAGLSHSCLTDARSSRAQGAL